MAGPISSRGEYIDVTIGLHPALPAWPGTPGFRLRWLKRIDSGDGCNNGVVETDLHVGTHVDAPLHFIEGGAAAAELDIDALVGPAVVGHVTGVPAVTPRELDSLGLPDDTQRLLLRTSNSELWAHGEREFQPDYVGLTADAARWIVERGIRLVGSDYLSVQRYSDDPTTHRVLLGAGVVIVEGLNLFDVPAGRYELICLPLKIIGADGAPARAVLRPLRKSECR